MENANDTLNNTNFHIKKLQQKIIAAHKKLKDSAELKGFLEEETHAKKSIIKSRMKLKIDIYTVALRRLQNNKGYKINYELDYSINTSQYIGRLFLIFDYNFVL